MFYQFSLSPQVKWGAIISNKHGTRVLSNELPKHVQRRSFGSYEKSEKPQNLLQL